MTRIAFLTLWAASAAHAQITPAATPVIIEVAHGVSARELKRGARPVLRVVATGMPVYATVAPSLAARQRFRVKLDSTITPDGTTLVIDAMSATLYAGDGDAVLARCARMTVAARASPRSAQTVAPAAVSAPSCEEHALEFAMARRKSATKSVLLNLLLPGVGQLYAHDRGRGWAMIGLYALGVAGLASAQYDERTGRWKHEDLAAGGYALNMILTATAMIDAPRAVRRYNERLLTSPTPP